jgi:hypothetical protein
VAKKSNLREKTERIYTKIQFKLEKKILREMKEEIAHEMNKMSETDPG